MLGDHTINVYLMIINYPADSHHWDKGRRKIALQKRDAVVFFNRVEAGKALTEKLTAYKGKPAVVLAVPRGGVETGWAVAQGLELPLDIVLCKKIGHPDNKEFAIGSVNQYGALVREQVDVSPTYVDKEIAFIQKLLRKRYSRYIGGNKPIGLKGKIAIIVDDGVATGSTLESSIDAVEIMKPKMIVAAVPVGPPFTIRRLSSKVHEMICLYSPEEFYAVGQFYKRFPQVSTEEVRRIMTEAVGYRKKLPKNRSVN